MKNKLLVFAATVLAIALGVGIRAYAAPADAKTASEVTVTIDNFNFSPASITVPVGAMVRWTNADDLPHTVVSDDKTFKSKALDTDEQFN